MPGLSPRDSAPILRGMTNAKIRDSSVRKNSRAAAPHGKPLLHSLLIGAYAYNAMLMWPDIRTAPAGLLGRHARFSSAKWQDCRQGAGLSSCRPLQEFLAGPATTSLASALRRSMAIKCYASSPLTTRWPSRSATATSGHSDRATLSNRSDRKPCNYPLERYARVRWPLRD